MPWLPATLTLLAAAAALPCLAAARRRRRAFVEVNPRWRDLLRRNGLAAPADFLARPGPVVGGHPGRDVLRLTLADGDEVFITYLKRESRISLAARLANARAGIGYASRPLREARTLQALARAGVGCPEWLAAGEDGRGRAFLLVRAAEGAADLRAVLGGVPDAGARRRLAAALGAALARLHAAGFAHGDLYAKHVLVGPGGDVTFLDWQRTRRGPPSLRRRAHDLAALHATLADDLAWPRDRLRCLRAYLTAFAGPGRRAARAALLREILMAARRLLRRRHVREKRQPPLAAGAQEWRCTDGEAFCEAPALREFWAADAAARLGLDQPARGGTRRWLPPPVGGPPALLERGRHWSAPWPWRRDAAAPEQRRAELLRRLERHGLPAPRVLAMGRRRTAPWRVEAFVLTRLPADAVRLTAWVARQLRPPETSARARRRRAVLYTAGALLHRLHDAGCRLDGRDPAAALAVRVPPDGPPTPALASADCLRVGTPRPALARADAAAVVRELTRAGCGPTDLRCFLAGYGQLRPAASAPPATPYSRLPAPPFWARLLRGWRRLRQRPGWAEFAGRDWPDRIMGVAVTDRFHVKQGRSTGRWVLHAGAGRLAVYLKRHYELPRGPGLLAALWPGRDRSPAFQEWDNLEWARRAGVPVPETVAAAEFLGPWGRLQSCLAVEELPDMLPLDEAVPLASRLLDAAAFRRWKCGLAAELARVARLLHDRRRFHKDFYLCHLFVARADAAAPPADWRGRVRLIDLHRLAHHPWTWPWWRLKDLAQLLYSSEVAGIDARDCLCFWRAYRGPAARRVPDRLLRRLIVFKWRRYRRHNARKRRMKDEG
jgi:heptose I phosphotransferase